MWEMTARRDNVPAAVKGWEMALGGSYAQKERHCGVDTTNASELD